MSISLEGSVRGCKVNTSWDARLQSDRFLNPQLMVCPTFNGMDSAGRRVCPDSYWTKTAGCNSAEDRVAVENYQRPQYMEYINLDAQGIRGDYYSMYTGDMIQADKNLADVHNITGQFGYATDFKSFIEPGCQMYPYQEAQAQINMQNRKNQALQEGYRANYNRKRMGM